MKPEITSEPIPGEEYVVTSISASMDSNKGHTSVTHSVDFRRVGSLAKLVRKVRQCLGLKTYYNSDAMSIANELVENGAATTYHN